MNVRSAATSFLAVSGLFVAGILLFNFVVMPALVHQKSAVIVPDLSGQSQAQAEHELKRLGLNLRVARSENHAQIPRDYVVEQTPRANETIKEGRTVQVVTSLGARTERVPELRGQSLRQARAAMTRGQFAAGSVARVRARGDVREEVIASTPPAGEELVEGSVVSLVVAVGGGKEEFLMPDLSGQDLLFIRDKLRDRGFLVSAVRYEKRKGIFPNTIVGQTPPPGSMIREGDSIELVAAGSN